MLTEIETLQLVEIIKLIDILEIGYDDFILEPLKVKAKYEHSIDTLGNIIIIKNTFKI